jgi:hypothetical protein
MIIIIIIDAASHASNEDANPTCVTNFLVGVLSKQLGPVSKVYRNAETAAFHTLTCLLCEAFEVCGLPMRMRESMGFRTYSVRDPRNARIYDFRRKFLAFLVIQRVRTAWRRLQIVLKSCLHLSPAVFTVHVSFSLLPSFP